MERGIPNQERAIIIVKPSAASKTQEKRKGEWGKRGTLLGNRSKNPEPSLKSKLKQGKGVVERFRGQQGR